MYRFTNKQSEFEIAGVRFGGQPGRRRTVLIGSLFYPRHSIVEDRSTGKVDLRKLEEAIAKLNKAAEETSSPCAVMLYAETERAIANHLDQVAGLTRMPLFIDSPSWAVRIAGIKAAGEMGIGDRVVYNTLNAGVTPEELQAVQNARVRSAVLLAFNPSDIQTKGKVYLLENGGGILPEGLIDLAREHGVKNILLDMAVMAAEQNAGTALRGIVVAKAKWGLPSGCAMHNAVESYAPLAGLGDEEKKLFRYVDVAAAVMPIMAGADFVMFGPVEFARRVCHAAAFADKLMEQAALDL